MGTRPNVLWMGDLEPYMDVNFVREAYENLGHSVVDVRLINNKHTGTSMERQHPFSEGMPAAYCFVEFKDPESAQKALFSLNGKIVPNSGGTVRFKLNHASYGREHLTMNGQKVTDRKDFSIFVGSLSDDVDDYTFFNTFLKKYPSTHSAKVVMDAQGKSRGYGFVRFKTEEERDKALKEMQRYKGLGKNLLHVSLAQAKSRPYTPATTTSATGTAATNSTWSQGWNQGGASYYYDPYYGWQQYAAAAGYTADPYQGYYDYSQYAAPGTGYTDPNAAATTAVAPATNPAQTASNMTQVQTTDTAATTTATTAAAASSDPDELEDPELNCDVDRLNAEFMERSEELYQALEGSRWHPLDNVMSTISVQQ